MSNRRIILVGPSAGGKNFIREKFIQKGFKADVSYTSREPREGETNGLDYNFISKEDFENKIKEGFFYEYVEYNGNYYGTGLYEFYNNDIFIMESDGIKHLKYTDRKSSLIIFVDTPEAVRINRMVDRGWDKETIEKRLKTDKEKFSDFLEYDLMIESI